MAVDIVISNIVNWNLIIAGAIGGIARAAYAALKSAESRRTVNLWLFLISVFTGAVIGCLIASVFNQGTTMSAVVGYIGTNIIDNVLAGVMPKGVSI